MQWHLSALRDVPSVQNGVTPVTETTHNKRARRNGTTDLTNSHPRAPATTWGGGEQTTPGYYHGGGWTVRGAWVMGPWPKQACMRTRLTTCGAARGAPGKHACMRVEQVPSKERACHMEVSSGPQQTGRHACICLATQQLWSTARWGCMHACRAGHKPEQDWPLLKVIRDPIRTPHKPSARDTNRAYCPLEPPEGCKNPP